MFLRNGRSGKMKVSSMVLLLVLVAAAYYGFVFSRVYWRRYSLTDKVDGQLAYAGQLADETIEQQMKAQIAKMHLPPAASRFRITRSGARTLQVRIAYTDTVNLLFSKKEIPISVTRRRTY